MQRASIHNCRLENWICWPRLSIFRPFSIIHSGWLQWLCQWWHMFWNTQFILWSPLRSTIIFFTNFINLQHFNCWCFHSATTGGANYWKYWKYWKELKMDWKWFFNLWKRARELRGPVDNNQSCWKHQENTKQIRDYWIESPLRAMRGSHFNTFSFRTFSLHLQYLPFRNWEWLWIVIFPSETRFSSARFRNRIFWNIELNWRTICYTPELITIVIFRLRNCSAFVGESVQAAQIDLKNS